MTHQESIAHWTAQLQPLVGLRITAVRYLTADELATMNIHQSAVVLQLGDGTLLWPMSDDEGNAAGSLFIQPGRTTQALPEQAPRI